MKKIIALIIAFVLVVAPVSSFAAGEQEYNIVSAIKGYVDANYKYEMDDDKVIDLLMKKALETNPELYEDFARILLDNLDEHSKYYTKEEYLTLCKKLQETFPDVSLTTDIIAGFCSETLEDHNDTLEMMRWVGYDSAYMFNYSQRSNTLAAKKYPDDIPYEEKTRRLEEIIELQRDLSLQSNRKDVGKEFEVLVEGQSKRNDKQLFGRTSQNKVVIFDCKDFKPGDYVKVKIVDCTSATLFGECL